MGGGGVERNNVVYAFKNSPMEEHTLGGTLPGGILTEKDEEFVLFEPALTHEI